MELSSKIKSMKFMKRKEDADERRKQEAQQRELAQQGHWKLASTTVKTTPKFRVEYDASLSGCGGSGSSNGGGSGTAGRQSFGEFNPETEKFNADEKKKTTTTAVTTVSDHEMAKTLSSQRRSPFSSDNKSVKRPLE